MIRLRLGTHPSDAQLVRFLDRQADLRTHRRLGAHLADCPACALRLAELERSDRVVREALAGVPVQLPEASRRALALSAMERARRRRPAPPRQRWMLPAAAVAGLLLVAAFSAQPSRAWVLRGVSRVAVELGALEVAEWLGGPLPAAPRGSGAAAPPPPDASVPAPGAVDERLAEGEAPPLRRTAPPVSYRSAPLSFDPAEEELVLEFDSYQREGTLSLWMMDSPTASVRITGSGRGETFQVLRSGLRIRNGAGSSARYEVVVPRDVRNVRIRIAGRQKAWIGIEPAESAQPWLWTVDLEQRPAP